MRRKSIDSMKTLTEESSSLNSALHSSSKERGAVMVEMVLLISLIAVGCIVSVRTIGQASLSNYEMIEESLALSFMH